MSVHIGIAAIANTVLYQISDLVMPSVFEVQKMILY